MNLERGRELEREKKRDNEQTSFVNELCINKGERDKEIMSILKGQGEQRTARQDRGEG